jgi:hypothetical protein
MFSMLTPSLKLVKRYRKRNRHLDWAAIHARWSFVTDQARDFLIDAQSKAINAAQRQGAEAIVKLSQNVPT